MKLQFALLKRTRLGLRFNPPSSQGAGRAPHLEMPGSAGGRAGNTSPQCAAYPSSGCQFSTNTGSCSKSGNGSSSRGSMTGSAAKKSTNATAKTATSTSTVPTARTSSANLPA